MIILLPIVFALMADSPPAIDFVRPSDTALQDSLNELEVCRSPNPSECWSPERERIYKVHGASCIPIAPDGDKQVIACRIDLTLTYADPKRGFTRHYDNCTRLSKRGVQDGKPEWEVVQVRDRPCEIPSMLTRDPNPEPRRTEIERAMVGMLTCHDFDGATDCFVQPEVAQLEAFRCKPIKPGEEYEARVACRITGDVRSSFGRPMSQFNNTCIRLDRITSRDRSPAYWVAIYVPEEIPCEIR